MQRRLVQTKVHFTTHKPWKEATAKKFFSSIYVLDATCFDKCFLSHVTSERRYFFWKLVVTLRVFQPPYFCILWDKCFERNPYFTLSPRARQLPLNHRTCAKSLPCVTYVAKYQILQASNLLPSDFPYNFC